MQCQSCGERGATLHLVHEGQGVSRELHICDGCAEQNGINIRETMSLSDVLYGFGSPGPDGALQPDRTCPACGVTSTDLRKGSRMGCGVCYETFKHELVRIIGELQKSDTHSGKVAARSGAADVPAVAALRAELDAAVAAEDYEKAARLRDEILGVKSGREVAG